MAIKHVTSLSMTAVVSELHRIRIAEDFSYEQLAINIGVSRRNLFRFMNDRGVRVRDTWLGRVVRYLDARQAASAADGSGSTEAVR